MSVNSSVSPDLSAPTLQSGAIAHALDVLVGGDKRLGLAVSGGSDSLGLLLHTHTWAHDRQIQLIVATVNHGLRPEAATEAASVASICRQLGVSHQTLTWRPPPGTVAQSRARAGRYALLTDWAARNQLPAIALGHTLDDRLETFLIRARAGSSWYGLAGPMPAAPAPLPSARPLRLIRPLLTTTRDSLHADLTAAGHSWINDPSNTSMRHERVRMRRLLAATSAKTRASILQAMTHLAMLRAATIAACREAIDDLSVNASSALLPPGCLEQLPQEARPRMLEAVIQSYAPRSAPLDAERLQTLIDTLLRPSENTTQSTLGNCTIRRSSRGVTIAPAPPRRRASPPPPPAPDPARRIRELLMDPHAALLRS